MCREKVVTVVMTSSKDSSDKALEAVRSTNDGFEDESDLVRDSLYALQGLPSAVRNLERLARSYNATSADKSSQNLTTLWTRSVTATALGKVLSLVARAGHLRCQLDAFVNFFLDGRHDDWDHSEDNPRRESKSKKKKKKKKEKSKNGPSNADKEENGGLEGVGQAKSGSGISNPDVLSSRCLVNQAFAAAVKTVLRGHSAALNTLAASVTLRRLQDTSEHGFRAAHLRDQDPGPVIGYGCRDITLLEFYLHTRELRVQLQALAYICLRRNGKTFVGNVVGDDDSLGKWSEEKTKQKNQEIGNWIQSQSDHSRRDHTTTTSFEDFPRGAALLTYLYEQLMEVDPLHMELLRFLFERAYQPYSVFIRSWIYQAAVKDPFCEFVIEQGDFNRGSSSINARGKRKFSVQPIDLKLRKGVSVPWFLEDVRIPLIRAGQQLQVLMKLAETCELAQQIGKTTNTSELFEGPDISSDSLAGDRKNSVNVPALVYSKMQLEETVNQREKNRKVLNEQFDNLFTELAARRLQMENSPSPSASDKPPISSVATNVDDKQLSADAGLESRQEAASPSLTIFPGGEEDTGSAVDGSTGLLKKVSGILVGDEEIAPVVENHPQSSSPAIAGIDITEPLASSLEGVVPSKEKSTWYPTKGNDEFKRLSAGRTGFCGPVQSEHKMIDKVEIYEPFQVSNFQFFEPAKVSVVSQSPESPKLHVPSLISDHQRGASWPLWGLPTNPFLMPATVNDFTPHFYAYTSFAGTFHPWDVTTKLSRAGLNSTQTSALEESARKQAEISVEPPWFTSLELALKDQLFEGLNAHLLLLEWDKADLVCEGDYGPLDSSKQSGNGWNTQLLVELDGRLTDPLNFSSSLHSDSETTADLTSPSGSSFLDQDILKKSSEKTEYIAMLESKANSNQGSDSTGKGTCKIQPVSELSQESPYGEFSKDIGLLGTSTEESNLLNQELGSSENGAGLVALASEVSALHRSIEHHQQYDLEPQEGEEAVVYEASKWQQYLRFSESPFESAVQHCSDGAANQDVSGSGEEIPLSVVVSKCVIQEILSQYESVSTLTVRLFHEGLCLQDHYHALRRYFFMERGDWADYFIAALCQNRWGPSGHQLRQMEVQGMLEAALQKSSCEGEEYAERLHVCFQARDPSSSGASAQGSTKISVAPFVDCSRLDAFDFISLEYRIDWPLTLVLTSHSLQLYNVIFSFLMRIKLAVYALADIWRRLQGFDKSLHKVRHSPQYQQQRNRFRTLQQLRQQIFHLVTTVQRYVESKLLYVVWSKFLHDIHLEVNDMQDLNALHCAYLEGAINECFLSPNTQGVKGCIDTIMQCVLDFLSHLKGASRSAGDEEVIDDHLFAQVCQVNKVFQSSLQLLNIYHMKQEPQYRTNLSDLWMILDFNGFVTNAFFSDS